MEPTEDTVQVEDEVFEYDAPNVPVENETTVADDTAEVVDNTPQPTVAESGNTRAAPTDLESDMRAVLDGVVTKRVALPEGKQATPHVISVLVEQHRGRGPAGRPSSGAVAAALSRWEKIGFAQISEGPVAFIDYTDEARNVGITELKRRNREAAKAARAAAKEPQPNAAVVTNEAPTNAPDAETVPVNEVVPADDQGTTPF